MPAKRKRNGRRPPRSHYTRAYRGNTAMAVHKMKRYQAPARSVLKKIRKQPPFKVPLAATGVAGSSMP